MVYFGNVGPTFDVHIYQISQDTRIQFSAVSAADANAVFLKIPHLVQETFQEIIA